MASYPPDIRARARDLWIAGGHTDAEIAGLLGVARADTIRDWRREGVWEDLRRAVDTAASARAEAASRKAIEKLNRRYDQLAEAVEALVIRAMKASGAVRAAEVRALAGAIAISQKVRRIANGAADESDEGRGPGSKEIRFTAGPPGERKEAPPPAPGATQAASIARL
jgi:transposase-like protein